VKRLAPVTLLVVTAACGQSRAPPPQSHADSTARLPPAQQLAFAESIYFSSAYDSARTWYRLILARAQADHDSITEAHALTWMGLAAWRLGEYSDARRLGEAALVLEHRASLTALLFRSYNALGLLAWTEGRLTDAEALFDSATQRAQADGDAANVGKAVGNLALVQVELGDFPAARNGFQQQRDAARRVGDTRVEANALTNLGMLAVRIGEPDAALPDLQQALDRYHAIDYATGVQNALGQLGTAFMALGQPRQAIRTLDSALSEARAHGLRQDEASDLEALADLHRQAGDYARALTYYAEARRIDEEVGLRVELGADQRSEAEIHAELGDYGVGRQYAQAALESHRAAGARFEMLEDLILLADLSDRQGDRAAADAGLSEVRDLARRLGSRTARLHAALAEARIADRNGESARTLRILDAVSGDVGAGGYDVAWESSALRARALARMGRLRLAEASGRRAVQAVERVRGNFGSGILRTAYAAARLSAYADLVDVLLRQGRPAAAFETSDAAHSRALLEHLASGVPGSDTAAQDESLLRQINHLAFMAESLSQSLDNEPDSAGAQELRLLAGRLAAARSRYSTLYVRAAELRGGELLGAASTHADSVQSALRPDEVLLEYLVTPAHVTTFVLTRDTVAAFSTPLSRENLESRIRLARDLIDRKADALAEPVLRALYETLLAPAERAGRFVNARRLVIVPYGILAYLPFAALRDSAGRYVAQRYSLVYLPIAAALPVVRRGRGQPPPGTWGAAVFAPEPSRLPASRAEAVAVGRALGGAEVVIGRGATERAVRGALLADRVVHVAAHGIMNARNPLFSELELRRGSGDTGDDGRLEVHELLDVPVRSALVFLSGCETGLGMSGSTAFARGEDYATLGQALLYAGARNVVATLWRVADVGASAFAQRFYHHLAELPAADALAAAQRDFIADSTVAAPFYWAAYTLTGSGDTVATESKAMAVSVH
jgi:CHAT domain-containing protein